MSTTINIVGGGDDLLRRVKEQQQSERLAFLTADKLKQLAKEADKANSAADESQGQRSLALTPYHRDPAAFRSSGGTAGVWHAWGKYEYPPSTGFGKGYLFIADPTFKSVLSWQGYDVPNAQLFSMFLPVGKNVGLYVTANSDIPHTRDPNSPQTAPVMVPINPAYYIKAAIVSPGRIREIQPPSGLRAKMIEWSKKGLNSNQWALGRHFGMLRPLGGINPGWWTPSVFTGLSGALNGISNANRMDYAYMRSNYFGIAPRMFLAQQSFDPGVYDPSRVKWRQTTTEPATVASVVPEAALRATGRSYWIKLGDEDANEKPADIPGGIDYQFYSAWDWGKSAYCKQQLLALGFQPSDLVP